MAGDIIFLAAPGVRLLAILIVRLALLSVLAPRARSAAVC